jgi:hypothetical protein
MSARFHPHFTFDPPIANEERGGHDPCPRPRLSDFRRIGDEVFERFKANTDKVGVIDYTVAWCRRIAERATILLVEELDRVVSDLERDTGVKGPRNVSGPQSR